MDEAPFELMYRPPGGVKHKTLTVVLDELFIRLNELEDAVERLYSLQKDSNN